MALYIIEVRVSPDSSKSFDTFLRSLQDQINLSIDKLLRNEADIFNNQTDSVMIVSHEYLYGLDYNNTGMTEKEAETFTHNLQLTINTIADKHKLDIALAPGTVVVRAEDPDKEIPRNRAYFFLPYQQADYTEKAYQSHKTFNWGEQKVCIYIYCNWSRDKYAYWRPEADIYFIPSSGMTMLPEKSSAKYFGYTNEIDQKPGITYINSDNVKTGFAAYTVNDTITESRKTPYLCREPEHIKYLSKANSLFDQDGIRIIRANSNPQAKTEEKPSPSTATLFTTERNVATANHADHGLLNS